MSPGSLCPVSEGVGGGVEAGGVEAGGVEAGGVEAGGVEAGGALVGGDTARKISFLQIGGGIDTTYTGPVTLEGSVSAIKIDPFSQN